MAATDPLNLHSLRKEQRRVAALLQADADPPKFHKRRRKPLAPDLFWCSHLDPDGRHRNPAWNYLREAFSRNPNLTLDELRNGFHYVKDKNEELFTPRRDEVNLKKRRNKKPVSKSVDFDERTKHRDREKEYKNMRKDLSRSVDGLKLPDIKDNNRVSKKPEPEAEVDDGKEKMHVRLPKEGDEARDDYSSPEFSRGKPKRYGKGRTQVRKSRKVRGKRVSYDGDSALEDMTSEDEYPKDPVTLLSDSGRAESDFSDHDPYLRYSHGRNPVGEDFIARRIQEEADGLMKITSFVSEKSFCSCCNSEHHERAPCPECKRVESHSKKCSRRVKKDKDRSNRKVGGRDTPPTLVGEASERCLKCGKIIRKSREASNVSSKAGYGRAWSRDSSESSGSYRLVRSRSESRGSKSEFSERGDQPRSRSASPMRQKRKSSQKEIVLKKDSDILDDLERKLRDGAFDYDVNVRMVDEIDQTIRLPGAEMKIVQNAAPPPKPRSKVDIYRDAYVKALSVARGRNLPSESWMLGNRTSKAFVYSYYHRIPRRRLRKLDGDEGQVDREPYEPPKIIKGRDAEMKMIFGKIKPDDFLPGGPRNPFEPNPLAYVKHERTSRPQKGKRRVQQATLADVKKRNSKQ